MSGPDMTCPEPLSTARVLSIAVLLGLLALTAANLRLRGRRRVPASGVALSAVVAGLLAVTGFLGGELSYTHKVGVAEPEA